MCEAAVKSHVNDPKYVKMMNQSNAAQQECSLKVKNPISNNVFNCYKLHFGG